MEGAQRALLRVLMRRLCALGLLSQAVCQEAPELVQSMRFPDFFRDAAGPVKEGEAGGAAQNPR